MTLPHSPSLHERTSQKFFERKYAADADPWDFDSSPYEQRRYTATIRALGHRRFHRVLEPGCSVGVLTAKLARLADHVEASDISPTAVRLAQHRCHKHSNVRLSVSGLNQLALSGDFDLLLLSEIGYYFSEAQLSEIAQRLVDQAATGGVLLAIHWLGTSEDHVLSGDCVHSVLHHLKGIAHEFGERHDEFRLDRWRLTG